MNARVKLVWACGLLFLFQQTSWGQLFPDAILYAPYSAIQEFEETNILSNGVRTTFKWKNRLYRDSRGRVREESYMPLRPGGPLELRRIGISDPVERVSYSINNVHSRVAERLIWKPAPPLAQNWPPMPWRGEGIIANGPPPPPSPGSFEESLGTRIMEGLLVEGQRRTITDPKRTQTNNDEPPSRIVERWFSKELNIVVYHKTSDPGTWEHTVRMTNISRAEPDLLLFQVPSDYSIRDREDFSNRREDTFNLAPSGPMIVPNTGHGYPFGNALVLNAPYSAMFGTEVQQTVDNVTTTVFKMEYRLYRDSKGRVRVERYSSGVSPRLSSLEIDDRAEGVHYSLNTHERIASRRRLILTSPGDANWDAVKRKPPPITRRQPRTPDPSRPQSRSESLGTEVMEGLLVEGRRTTTIYPAGSVGNDNPFSSVLEEWYSDELKMVIFRSFSDPHIWDRTIRIKDISRSEPNPQLFQVPLDYTIEDRNSTFPLPTLH